MKATKQLSLDAKRSMEHVIPSLRERLLQVIKAAGETGLTTDEAEMISTRPHQTVSPRINELARLGVIKDSGIRRTTRSGRKAVVYVAK